MPAFIEVATAGQPKLRWRHATLAVVTVLSLLPVAPTAAAPAAAAELQAWRGDAPALVMLDLVSGGRTELSAYRGRVVLLHFFATWCEPCRPELAALQRLAERYRARPLAIVAVSVAEVELRLRRFFATQPVSFPVALDRDRAMARAWAVTSLPTTVVLDRDLTPRFVVEADLDWDRPQVDQLLDRLLSGGQAQAYQSKSETKP